MGLLDWLFGTDDSDSFDSDDLSYCGRCGSKFGFFTTPSRNMPGWCCECEMKDNADDNGARGFLGWLVFGEGIDNEPCPECGRHTGHGWFCSRK